MIIKVSGAGVADPVVKHEELQDRLKKAELLQKHGDLERANEVYSSAVKPPGKDLPIKAKKLSIIKNTFSAQGNVSK